MVLESGSEEESQAAFDDWLARHSPPKVQTDLEDLEAEHLASFLADYGRGVSQLYIGFDQLVALVDQANFIDKTSWPQHRVLQFILIAKNLKGFHSALDRLSKGSYQDAMALTRTQYETLLRVVHISVYNPNPWGALVDRPGTGVPRFNATNLAKDVLRLDWRKYGIMSPFAHSNVDEVMQAVQRQQLKQGEPERLGLAYENDPTLVEAVFPFIQFLVLAYLRYVCEVLVGSAEMPDAEQLAEAHRAIEWARFTLAANPKPYWKQVLDDLDYIFTVVALADAGGDWQAVRNQREPVSERGPDAGPDSSA